MKEAEENSNYNHHKYLISVIVAPMYNFEDFRIGKHLEQLGLLMENKGSRNRSTCKNIISNENKRYHYLKFNDDVPIPESVVDFKHYFTINILYLENIYEKSYVCSVDSLYRELISQRFSNFLSRIGLPDPE